MFKKLTAFSNIKLVLFRFVSFSILAENLHYPISNENDLLEFLREIDGNLLYKMTYQKDYVPGFGRKSFNRIWSICIEGLVVKAKSFLMDFYIG